MTHFCSLRLTHTKNTFCRRARDGASNIIHAEGVRGDFPSSAPKARNPLTSHEEAACAGEGIDGRWAVASLHSICRAARKALLPGGKTPPNWRWWRVTFGEQSRVISRERRRRWGVLSGECRLQGKQVKVADGLIVATALHHQLTIVTRNVKDFAGLGVEVLNPWET